MPRRGGRTRLPGAAREEMRGGEEEAARSRRGSPSTERAKKTTLVSRIETGIFIYIHGRGNEETKINKIINKRVKYTNQFSKTNTNASLVSDSRVSGPHLLEVITRGYILESKLVAIYKYTYEDNLNSTEIRN